MAVLLHDLDGRRRSSIARSGGQAAASPGVHVSQAFCSALPLGMYADVRPDLAAPFATLILEGANDVNGGTSLAQVNASLATMIQAARGRGQVFVATVPPQRAGACRSFNPSGVRPLDDQIRSTVRTEGAVLVDIYDVVFGGVPDPFIGKDGLHPTVDGYARIADAFFAAITARLQN